MCYSLARGQVRFSKKRNQYEASNMMIAADGSYSMSYGWYYMHRTFKLGKENFIVKNGDTYSPSTGRHFSKMERHCGYSNYDLKVYDHKGLVTVKGMVESINDQIEGCLRRLNKKGIRQTTKETLLRDIEQLYKDLQIVRKLREV